MSNNIIYPKISIVTPNFNGGKYLEQTIKSVLSQDYPNLEYIIIDGGSTDDSVSIIKKYQSQLSYWVSEPDKGLYDAIQKGFNYSTGEIMAWINSDDLYHPKAFFSIAEIFSNFDGVKWLMGIPSTFDEMGRTVAVSSIRRWTKLDYYLGDYQWIQQESIFWRRSLWVKAGEKLSIEMKYAGDLELWLRFFRYEKLFVTSALIGGFRQRKSGQLSLEFLDEYLEEASGKIEEELKNYVSKEEKNLIRKLKRYNSLLRKVHFTFMRKFINKFFYSETLLQKQLFFGLPPIISFDRKKQEYIINQ